MRAIVIKQFGALDGLATRICLIQSRSQALFLSR